MFTLVSGEMAKNMALEDILLPTMTSTRVNSLKEIGSVEESIPGPTAAFTTESGREIR